MGSNYLVSLLNDAIGAKDEGALKEICTQSHPAAIAESLRDLQEGSVELVLRVLNTDQTAVLFEHLEVEQRESVAGFFTDEQIVAIAHVMSSDERVDFLKTLGSRSEQIIRKMAREEREDIRRLGSYAEGTAGAVMTSDYAALGPKLTVKQAIDRLRLEAPDKETIYYSYVVDDARRLLGLVSLKNLILAKSDAKLEDIMRRDLLTVRTDDPQFEAAEKLSKYDLLAIPVVTDEGALVGILTFDDVLDVQEEEATSDFHKMGTVRHFKGNVRDASTWFMVQKRLPWLLVLVFVNLLSGAGIAIFETTLQKYIALVYFLPLLIGSGGNAGSQSATLMVRAIATGDVRLRDWFSMLQKELMVALVIGILMCVAVSVVGFYRAPEIVWVVMVTMVLVVLTGSLVGMCLPFIFTRLNIDPATASAPLVTSLVDISGVIIYFGVATLLL
jgi:magnesium transporter